MPANDPFNDLFDVFDTFTPKQEKKPELGVPWEAKKIDGKYYVPLSQVAELLKKNDVLPAIRRGIERRTIENWNPDGT